MKKKIFLLLLMAGQFMAGSAKDVIVLKNTTPIEAKVLEVTPTEVKYKKISNLEGPTYVIYKSEINTIVYENGEVESFVQESETNTDKTNTPQQTNVSENNTNKELQLYPTLDRVNGQYVLGNVTMSKKEYGDFLHANCPVAYEKWQRGTKRVRCGWIFAITGLTCEVMSTVSFISYADSEHYNSRGYYTYDDGALAMGIATLVPAILLETTAIPLLATGYSSRRKSIGLYNEQCAPKNSAFDLRLNLKGNGLGLSLNF
jgi:hypothetical protein